MAKRIICIATPLLAPDIGGPATHVALLQQQVSKEHYDLRIVPFSSVRNLPKVLRHITYFLYVLKTARTSDFIYALDPVSVGFPAALAATVLHKKLLLRVGGDYAWEQGTQRFGVRETLDEFVAHTQPSSRVRALQAVQSYVAGRAVRIIAPSEYLAGIVRTWGVSPERVTVVYSQPELGKPISQSDARKELSIKQDEEIIFSAGRLVSWKGFEAVIDAVSAMRRTRPVRLYIAGSGPWRDELATHIRHTAAEEYVTLLGQLPKGQMALWYAAADMFVLNTRYEGLSHALLEAFNARTPVITTRAGGNSELVQPGTGLLVEYNNTEELEVAIRKLLEEKTFANGLAEAAYNSLSRFAAEIARTRLESIFASL